MEPEISNTELWKAEYYPEGCDSLLAVHRILCRAVNFKYVTVGKQKYLSIIPLNRRFNLQMIFYAYLCNGAQPKLVTSLEGRSQLIKKVTLKSY